MKYVSGDLVGKPEGNRMFGGLGVDEKTILKIILQK
jgi:hypothetical protein